MNTFDFRIWNRHVFIEIEGENLLIDTGSPQSFSTTGMIKIADKEFQVPKGLLSVNSQYLTNQLSYRFDGLIGMDIMKEFTVCFNSPLFGNFIGFFDKNDATGFPLSESKNIMGCPCIELNVNNIIGSYIFDTGAPISYCNPKTLGNLRQCGSTSDFSPLLGEDEFDVTLYYTNVSFKGGSFNAIFGKMPDKLEFILNSFGIDGIIGFDLLNHNRLTLSEGKLYLPPQGI